MQLGGCTEVDHAAAATHRGGAGMNSMRSDRQVNLSVCSSNRRRCGSHEFSGCGVEFGTKCRDERTWRCVADSKGHGGDAVTVGEHRDRCQDAGSASPLAEAHPGFGRESSFECSSTRGCCSELFLEAGCWLRHDGGCDGHGGRVDGQWQLKRGIGESGELVGEQRDHGCVRWFVEVHRSGVDGVSEEFMGERVEIHDPNLEAQQPQLSVGVEAPDRGASRSFDS